MCRSGMASPTSPRTPGPFFIPDRESLGASPHSLYYLPFSLYLRWLLLCYMPVLFLPSIQGAKKWLAKTAVCYFFDRLFRVNWKETGTGATFELVFTRNNRTGRARGERCRYNIHITSEAQATAMNRFGQNSRLEYYRAVEYVKQWWACVLVHAF